MSGMSLLAGKALSSARMSDILSQTSLTGSQQLQQREESGQQHDTVLCTLAHNIQIKGAPVLQYVTLKGSFTQQPATLPPAPVICFSLTSPLTCSTAWSRLESSTGTPGAFLSTFDHPVTLPGVAWCFLSLQVWLGNHRVCVLPHRWRGFPVYSGPYQPSWVVLSWAASCQTSILPEQGPPSVHPSTSVPVWAVCGVGVGGNFKRGGLWGLTGEASMFKKCQLYLHGHPGVITTGVPLFHLITGRLGFPSSKPTILPPPLPLAQIPAPHPHVGLHHYVPHWLMVCCLLRFTKKHCCHKPKVFTSGVRASVWEKRGWLAPTPPPSHKRSFQSRIKALGWFGWSDYSSVTLRRINQLSVFFPSVFIWKNNFTADV